MVGEATITQGMYSANTTHFIPGRDLYLLGILNSGVGGFCFSSSCAALEGPGGSYLRFFGQYLKGVPVRTINPDRQQDAARDGEIVRCVERMVALHQQLAAAKRAHDRTGMNVSASSNSSAGSSHDST